MKDMLVLASKVHRAIGKAAMCWSEMPSGQYDDARANLIAEELIADIRETMMGAGLAKALDNEKPEPSKKHRQNIPRD
jgi:nitrogen fixation-related uncharacterized protein